MNTKTKSNDSKSHPKRKNPTAHAAWMARKKALNAARYTVNRVVYATKEVANVIVDGTNDAITS
jgi:hypothetical protein